MDQVQIVGHKVLVEGQWQRAVARELGLARVTVRKYLDQSGPARTPEPAPRPRPVWEAVAPRVEAVRAESVRWTGGKQRLTATRLHAMLRAEGHPVGVTMVTPIIDIATTRDGKYAATAAEDGYAKVWDVESGQLLSRIAHPRRLSSLELSPKGRYLLSHQKDDLRQLWAWKVEDTLAEARRRVGRNLSRDEWALYLPEEKYRKTFEELPEPTKPHGQRMWATILQPAHQLRTNL